MKLTTRQTLARDAVSRAKSQPNNMYEWAVKLRALPDDATVAQVDAAVGHSGQTYMHCHECGRTDSPMLVQVGEPPDYESSTADLCPDCVRAAMEIVKAEEDAKLGAFIARQRDALKDTIRFVRENNPDLDDDARALIDKYIADETAALTAMLEREE